MDLVHVPPRYGGTTRFGTPHCAALYGMSGVHVNDVLKGKTEFACRKGSRRQVDPDTFLCPDHGGTSRRNVCIPCRLGRVKSDSVAPLGLCEYCGLDIRGKDGTKVWTRSNVKRAFGVYKLLSRCMECSKRSICPVCAGPCGTGKFKSTCYSMLPRRLCGSENDFVGDCGPPAKRKRLDKPFIVSNEHAKTCLPDRPDKVRASDSDSWYVAPTLFHAGAVIRYQLCLPPVDKKVEGVIFKENLKKLCSMTSTSAQQMAGDAYLAELGAVLDRGAWEIHKHAMVKTQMKFVMNKRSALELLARSGSRPIIVTGYGTEWGMVQDKDGVWVGDNTWGRALERIRAAITVS